MRISNDEDRFFSMARQDAQILFTNGAVIQGQITWTTDHTVGFIPGELQYAPGTFQQLDDVFRGMGLMRGRESLVYKGFIRIVTPMGEHERPTKERGSTTPARLQQVAGANRKHR